MLGGCRVEGVIARGGMGVVYRAVQLDLRRPVALKVITADRAGDPEFRERFERESRMAAAIDHPNIVPIYAAGEDGGALYIVMRYVPGTDLHALIKRSGKLPATRAAAIVAQVASALDVAHAAGLVHRDVKPANVLLAGDGAGDHAYLTDFGLARSLDPDEPLTESGSWIGTVDFASPEQLGGERLDARSDVYSLGCVLHAAITGLPPFPRGTVPATLLAHLQDPPPKPSQHGADVHFDRVIARALAKAPGDRYPSAGDLGRASLAAARGEPVTETERTVAIGPAAPNADPPTAPTAIAGAAEPATRAPARTRVRRQPEPPLVPPTTSTRRARGARRPRPRPRRGTLAAALALPLAGIVTVGVLMLGSDDDDNIATAQTRPLAESEVRFVTDAFAEAYETEDGAALGRLLTSDVKRVLPDGIVRGRRNVVTQYETQFKDNVTQSYEIENLDARGGEVGRASGDYRVRRALRPSLEGRIVLSVVRDRGRTRIGLIAVTPAADDPQ
jgi:predicted Ser/Thr protein kinase